MTLKREASTANQTANKMDKTPNTCSKKVETPKTNVKLLTRVLSRKHKDLEMKTRNENRHKPKPRGGASSDGSGDIRVM